MNKSPQPPHVRAERRKFHANALAATALWVTTALLLAFPFALVVIWGVTEDIAGPIGGVAWVVGGGLAFPAGFLTGDAWRAHDRYRRYVDEIEWKEYQAEQRLMEKIMREEGLA